MAKNIIGKITRTILLDNKKDKHINVTVKGNIRKDLRAIDKENNEETVKELIGEKNGYR